MADITVTAAQVAPVYPHNAIIRPYAAGATITAGQTVYWTTAGLLGLCDANDSGKEQFRGIALNGGGSGQRIDVLEDGECYGFSVSALNVDAILYQGDTAGALADAASGTKTVAAARVILLPDGTKAIRVFQRLSANW